VRDGGFVGALLRFLPSQELKKATAESPTQRVTPKKELEY